MTTSTKTRLAIQDGSKAVTIDNREQWQRPVEAQKRAVCELVERGFVSGAGRDLPKLFEDEFREFVGCRYVLTTSQGHTALASAYFAAGLGRGDEFLAPVLGYIGSYAGALHMGATPVFSESDPETLLMDPRDVEKRITPKTRVVNPIHWNGRVCDMDALLDLCEKHDLVLVEDAAHAHGTEWDGVRIGNLGHIACFSLQGIDPGGKPVTAGEGGIVATNDRELYERALVYCHLHRSGAVEELENPVYRELGTQFLGWKWRAHPLALALGRVSLKTLPHRLKSYAANRDELAEGIAGLEGVRLVHNYPKSKGSELFGGLRFLYDPDALGGLSAERFCEALQAEGVPMKPNPFITVEHRRAVYNRDLPGLWGKNHVGPADVPLPRYHDGDYPVTERLFDGRMLGMNGWIEAKEGLMAQVAEGIVKVVQEHRALL